MRKQPPAITRMSSIRGALLASLCFLHANADDTISLGYDSLPDAGSAYNVRSVLFDMEIAPDLELTLESYQFRARGSSSVSGNIWDYELYFREGSLADDIGGSQAHQVAGEWQLVGVASGVVSDGSADWFTITLDQGPANADGLSLDQGRYSFCLFGRRMPGSPSGSSSNGVRVVNPADVSLSDQFDLFWGNAEISFLRGDSKQSLFGSSDLSGQHRTPLEMVLNYRGGSGGRIVSDYEAWIEQHLPPGSTAAQPLEDPDADRVPNALEWALGGDPLVPSPGNYLDVAFTDDGHADPVWNFRRRVASRDSIALTLETSGDLIEWERHPVPETSTGTFTIISDESDTDFELVFANLAATTPVSSGFARIAMDAARVVAVNALHYDGPYFLSNNDGSIREIRVAPGPSGPIISDVTHEDGLSFEKFPVYPDGGAPGEDTKLPPFIVRFWDFPVEEEWDFAQPDRIFAIADVECGFSETQAILRAGGVIDDRYNWIFGDGHLVVNGDVFSRGTDMMALLWLLYKLDYESRAAGGRMHFMIGNHEWMNLSGDERYVMARYLDTSSQLDVAFKDLFGPDTELGRWIRTKNTIIRIGRNLIVHAGISPGFISAEYTPQEANQLIRENIGLRRSQMNARADYLFQTPGPLWFRGMVSTNDNHSPISTAQIDPILAHFNVDRVIVGHTKSNELRYHRDRRVVAIDVDHTGARIRGDTRGLLLERVNGEDVLRAVDDAGEAHELPLRD
jgi:hypothetical protein